MIKQFQEVLYHVTKYFKGIQVDFVELKNDKVTVGISQYEADFYSEKDTRLLIKLIKNRLYEHGYEVKRVKYDYDFPTNPYDLSIAAKITFIVDV